MFLITFRILIMIILQLRHEIVIKRLMVNILRVFVLLNRVEKMDGSYDFSRAFRFEVQKILFIIKVQFFYLTPDCLVHHVDKILFGVNFNFPIGKDLLYIHII